MVPVFLHYDELSSTHDHAIRIISKTKPQEATVIVAANQTAGKGRYDRHWISQPNTNVLLSCILYPIHLQPQQSFYLNIASTLASVQLLEHYSIDEVAIKWPNDVLVNDKKIAGTLIHNQFSGKSISSSVLSIGLNVNQRSWSDEPRATSIVNCIGRKLDKQVVLERLISNLLSIYERSKTDTGLNEMRRLWLHHLKGQGQMSRFELSDGSRISAKISDILENGMLEIDRAGRSYHYHMDSIRFIDVEE